MLVQHPFHHAHVFCPQCKCALCLNVVFQHMIHRESQLDSSKRPGFVGVASGDGLGINPQIEGYLHSLTHNVLVGKIDDFAEVLQEIIDEMSEECQVSDGDKMVVKVATQQKLLCIMVRNGKRGQQGIG